MSYLNFFALVFVYLAVPTALIESRHNTAAFLSAASTRVSSPSHRSPWISPSYSARVQSRALRRLHVAEFDQGELAHHLEDDFKGDLARLAMKFGSMIESVDNIESVHVSEVDGDHMSLDVVYCDSGEQTCVAVAVPIKFPHHCDNEDCVIGMIRELEKMEDVVPSANVQLPKRPIDPHLMTTIARIVVVMNRDFQDELASFMRAFGGPKAQDYTGECEMTDLTPDGFTVRASDISGSPVTIAFPRECLCAEDFQVQILALSERAMMVK